MVLPHDYSKSRYFLKYSRAGVTLFSFVSLSLLLFFISALIFAREGLLLRIAPPEQGGSSYGAVARVLASHQCGPGKIPGPGVICGFSTIVVGSRLDREYTTPQALSFKQYRV